MPITEADSGLSSSDYTLLAASRLHAAYQVLAYQWDLDLSVTGSVSGTTGVNFDAAVLDDQVIRLINNTPQVWQTSSWALLGSLSAAPSQDNTIAGSLVVDGVNAYVFVVSGSGSAQTVYRATWNGSSWSSPAQQNATTFDIVAMAATGPNRCHIVVSSGSDRYELLCIDNGVLKRQSLYWPFPVESLSVTALDATTDVVALTTMLPGATKIRTLGTTINKEIVPSGGVVVFRYTDGAYSDHIEVERVDEWQPWRYRKYVRASTIDGTVYLTVYTSDGTKLGSFRDYRLYSSKDGRFWSRGELLGFDVATPGGLKLLSVGDQVWGVQYNRQWASPRTLRYGVPHSSLVLDLTSRVLRPSLQFSGLLQGAFELDNTNDYWADTFLNGEHTVALVFKEGYHPAIGEPRILVQTALLEVDSFEVQTGVQDGQYRSVLVLTARDHLAWMSDKTQSEQFLSRNPQIVGSDDYVDDTTTGYGGLAHTATWQGSFRTDAGKLVLWSNNEEAQAASTFDIDAWNFDISVGFHLSQVTNDEYAGFLFHAQDYDHLFRVFYDQDEDQVRSKWRVDGIETSLSLIGGGEAQSSVLSWAASPATVRWLRLRAYYGLLFVYSSTDGISWDTLLFTAVLPGQPALPVTEAGSFPDYVPQNGFVGLVGQGYNPDETWDVGTMVFNEISWLWEFVVIEDVSPFGDLPGSIPTESVNGGMAAWVSASLSANAGIWSVADTEPATPAWTRKLAPFGSSTVQRILQRAGGDYGVSSHLIYGSSPLKVQHIEDAIADTGKFNFADDTNAQWLAQWPGVGLPNDKMVVAFSRKYPDWQVHLAANALVFTDDQGTTYSIETGPATDWFDLFVAGGDPEDGMAEWSSNLGSAGTAPGGDPYRVWGSLVAIGPGNTSLDDETLYYLVGIRYDSTPGSGGGWVYFQRLYRSADYGATWTLMRSDLADMGLAFYGKNDQTNTFNFFSMKVPPYKPYGYPNYRSTGQHVYLFDVETSDFQTPHFWHSDDGGLNWTELGSSQIVAPNTGQVCEIYDWQIHPKNARFQWIAIADAAAPPVQEHVLYTVDGGSNWGVLPGSLRTIKTGSVLRKYFIAAIPNNVEGLVLYHESDPTSIGYDRVSVTYDQGATWSDDKAGQFNSATYTVMSSLVVFEDTP